jgi:hypothetical protein
MVWVEFIYFFHIVYGMNQWEYKCLNCGDPELYNWSYCKKCAWEIEEKERNGGKVSDRYGKQ